MADRLWTVQVGDRTSPRGARRPEIGISINNAGDEENRIDVSPEGQVQASTNRGRRGRPLGSRNKPKPPTIVTQNSPDTLQCHLIEIPTGSDIARRIEQYGRDQRRGVYVFSASGIVTNVALIQPSANGSVMVLHGQYDITSLTGTFLPTPAPPGCHGLTIYMSGRDGQVVGGRVVGSLVAAGPVIVVAGTFIAATYERLPLEEDGGGGVPGAGASNVFMGVHGNLPPNFVSDGDSGSGSISGGGSGGGGQLNDYGFGWIEGGQPPI